jgi:hypothetical protein
MMTGGADTAARDAPPPVAGGGVEAPLPELLLSLR